MLFCISCRNSVAESLGIPSQVFRIEPSGFNKTVSGKIPDRLYCSAILSLRVCCSAVSLFFLLLGKSALTITRFCDDQATKSGWLKIFFFICIQGAHQSEPEKFSRTVLFFSLAILMAVSKSVSHLTWVCHQNRGRRNKSFDIGCSI